jgi:DNA polymerase alpha-associated DNA helicase A
MSNGNRRHANVKATKLPITKQAADNTTKGSPKEQTGQVATLKQVSSGDDEDRDSSSGSDSANSNDYSPLENLEKNKPISMLVNTKATCKVSSKSLLRPPKTLGTTMFDRLETMYGKEIKCMLDVQYRSVTSKCSVPHFFETKPLI